MKYRMVLTGTTIEVFTDHKYPVKLPFANSSLYASGLSGSLIYGYKRVQWTRAGTTHLLDWLQAIDSTATYRDIAEMARSTMAPVDLLTFYSELNEMGLSHLE